MLREPTPQQLEIEMVTLDSLVPADHLLRKIDSFISFDFIRDKVRDLTDSTHLKASANKKKWCEAQATPTARAYLEELEQAVEEDRLRHGKKPLPDRTDKADKPELFTAPGYWAGLLRKAQLTHREPYQLRHSYASLLLMAGAHPAYLAKQLGHKDWGMIRTIYAQWVSNDNPDYRKELAEKLGQDDPYKTHRQSNKA